MVLAAATVAGRPVRADPPEVRLDGVASWQGFWYPRSLPAQPGTDVSLFANEAQGAYEVVRDGTQEYATSRNQVLFQPRLKARWNDVGAVAEVQLRHDFSDPSRSRILLKELYADLRIGGFYAAAGNQAIRWGRMDVFSPLDVLTPRDFEDPFLAEPLAAPAIQLKYSLPFLSVQAVLMPGFVPSRYPVFAPARYDVLIPQPRAVHQPGGDFQIPTVYEAMAAPALTPADDPDPDDEVAPLEAQVGLRLEVSGAPGDLAAYVYRGRDRLPSWFGYDILNASGIDDFTLVTAGEADVALTPWHQKVTVVGLDGDLVLGPVVVKGEAAWTRTEDPGAEDCSVDDPYLKWAAGAEVMKNDIGGGVGLAVRVEATGDHELPSAESGGRNTEGLCLDDEVFPDILLYDPKHLNALAFGGQVLWTFTPSLQLDLRGFGSIEKDWMFRAEARYTFQEKLRIAAAAMLVGGSEEGISGERPGYFWWYRDNDRLELSVAYLF